MLFDRNSTNTSVASNSSLDPNFIQVIFWIRVCWFSFILFAGTVMNSVIVLVTFLDRRLHNANKYFVASLVVSDLLSTITNAVLIYQQFHNLQLSFCFFLIWINIFIENSSITALMIISIDRYVKITKPFKYRTLMSTSKSRNIIIFVWFYSAVVASFGIMPYPSFKGVYSMNDKCNNDNPNYYIAMAFVAFFLPVIFLIIMCILMFLVVKRIGQEIFHSQNPDAMRVHDKRTINSNFRVVGIYTLIVCTLVVSWGPFFIIVMFLHYKISLSRKVSIILGTVATLMPNIKNILDPVIYVYFDKTFNVAIRDFMSKVIRCRRQRHITNTSQTIHSTSVGYY